MKDPFAARFKRVAMALVKHFAKQSLHELDFAHLLSQLGQLSSRKLFPTFGSWCSLNEAGKELLDLLKCES